MAKQGASSPKWLDKQDFSGVVSKYRKCTLSLKTLNLDITRCRLADCHITVTVSKCVPHVQHDYFSSFNQSDHYFLASSLPLLPSLLDKIGTLNNHHHHDDGDKNVTNLHIWQWKTNIVLHALQVQFSFLYISLPFSSFPRREMTCFAVAWTTWAYDDKFSIFSKSLKQI